MKHAIYIKNYQSPFGELIIGSYNDQLVLCDWKYRKMRESIDLRIKKSLNADIIEKTTSIIGETIDQLNEYAAGKRKAFDIPLLLVGTEFQQSVWNKLLTIPYGQTTSYLKLSQSLNNPKAIRAVASANGANALSILVPCHRVIGSNNELIGYAGGLSAKRKLLSLEGGQAESDQLRLF